MEMNEQFVTFEIAKRLQDLGFYFKKGFAHFDTVNDNMLFFHPSDESKDYEYSRFIYAPLWQQAIDWCWEKGYWINVFPLTKTCFGYSIDFKRTHPDNYNEKDYSGVTNTKQILNQIVEEEKLKGWENIDCKQQAELKFSKLKATEAAILKALELISK